MLRQDHLRTLKQTHQTATTVMPLVTAGLALMSAVIAAHERRTASTMASHLASRTEESLESLDRPRIVSVTTRMTTAQAVTPARERRDSVIGSAMRYLATLLGAFIKVTIGALAVIALVTIYFNFDKTNRAVLLTVLIVSMLYLTARVARSRQRREAGR
jgi:hypothetical protein